MSWLQRTAASCGWVNPHRILTVKDIEEQITLVSMSKNPDHQMPIDIYATLCNAIQGRKISLSTLRSMNLLTESSIRGHQRFIEVLENAKESICRELETGLEQAGGPHSGLVFRALNIFFLSAQPLLVQYPMN